MNGSLTLCLEVIFWFALFVVFYTYLGYGIVLYILVKLKELFVKPVKYSLPASNDELPEVTLFITAFNEEDVVDEKMENSLELDYPADKLRIVWVTDGSDDGTNERLQTRWAGKATVLHCLKQFPPHGKQLSRSSHRRIQPCIKRLQR